MINLPKIILITALLGLGLTGCSTIDPLKLRYITYSDSLPQEHKKITTVEVRIKGKSANIEEVLPYLKESIHELNIGSEVVISNVKITPFHKTRKDIDTYKTCTAAQPASNNNGNKYENYYFTQSIQSCDTNYVRSEKLINYLQITADVLYLADIIII
jgi:hypothetical protein